MGSLFRRRGFGIYDRFFDTSAEDEFIMDCFERVEEEVLKELNPDQAMTYFAEQELFSSAEIYAMEMEMHTFKEHLLGSDLLSILEERETLTRLNFRPYLFVDGQSSNYLDYEMWKAVMLNSCWNEIAAGLKPNILHTMMRDMLIEDEVKKMEENVTTRKKRMLWDMLKKNGQRGYRNLDTFLMHSNNYRLSRKLALARFWSSSEDLLDEDEDEVNLGRGQRMLQSPFFLRRNIMDCHRSHCCICNPDLLDEAEDEVNNGKGQKTLQFVEKPILSLLHIQRANRKLLETIQTLKKSSTWLGSTEKQNEPFRFQSGLYRNVLNETLDGNSPKETFEKYEGLFNSYFDNMPRKPTVEEMFGQNKRNSLWSHLTDMWKWIEDILIIVSVKTVICLKSDISIWMQSAPQNRGSHNGVTEEKYWIWDSVGFSPGIYDDIKTSGKQPCVEKAVQLSDIIQMLKCTAENIDRENNGEVENSGQVKEGGLSEGENRGQVKEGGLSEGENRGQVKGGLCEGENRGQVKEGGFSKGENRGQVKEEGQVANGRGSENGGQRTNKHQVEHNVLGEKRGHENTRVTKDREWKSLASIGIMLVNVLQTLISLKSGLVEGELLAIENTLDKELQPLKDICNDNTDVHKEEKQKVADTRDEMTEEVCGIISDTQSEEIISEVYKCAPTKPPLELLEEFLEALRPVELVDLLIEKSVVTEIQQRNNSEQKTARGKNLMNILELMQRNGEKNYQTFINCLAKINQVHLKDYLERKDSEVKEESKENIAQRTKVQLRNCFPAQYSDCYDWFKDAFMEQKDRFSIPIRVQKRVYEVENLWCDGRMFPWAKTEDNIYSRQLGKVHEVLQETKTTFLYQKLVMVQTNGVLCIEYGDKGGKDVHSFVSLKRKGKLPSKMLKSSEAGFLSLREHEKSCELRRLMKSDISFRIEICLIYDFLQRTNDDPVRDNNTKGLFEFYWEGNTVTLNEVVSWLNNSNGHQTGQRVGPWIKCVEIRDTCGKGKPDNDQTDLESTEDIMYALPAPANQLGPNKISTETLLVTTDIQLTESDTEEAHSTDADDLKSEPVEKLLLSVTDVTREVQPIQLEDIGQAISNIAPTPVQAIKQNDINHEKVDENGDRVRLPRNPLDDLLTVLPGPRLEANEVQVFFNSVERNAVTIKPEYQLSPKFDPLPVIVSMIAEGKTPKPQITMRYEALRFCTLRTYPRENKPFLTKFAQAGWYYASDEDGVVCYCCGIRRYGWNSADDPMTVHRRINSNCKFIKRNEDFNVPMYFIGPLRQNVAALDEIPDCTYSPDYGEDVNNDHDDRQTTETETQAQGPLRAGPGKNGLGINMAMPKHPQYAPKTVRENSYTGWPNTSIHTSLELADAGFYYAGFGDCVRCFYCGIGLRHWDKDDNVWIEHARWSKNCVFLRQKKGQEFINLVQLAIQYTNDIEEQSGATTGQIPQPELERYLLSDAAQSVLEMGYTPLSIKQALENILTTDRTIKITAMVLMEKILDMEERAGQPSSASAPTARSTTATTTPSTSQASSLTTVNQAAANTTLVTVSEQSRKVEKPNGATGNDNDVTSVAASQGKKLEKKADVKKETNKSADLAGKDPKAIKAENEQLKEQTICKVCLDNAVCIVFLPCGHLVTCADCAPAMRKCPICRAVVKGTVRTYMS